ncbi:phosphomannomutase, partial [Vibrio cholerae]|nr:phosphomannomutase [Vibrio cholerae]
CIAAIQAQGFEAIYYGVIPTPALAYSAMQDEIPCIMVTGSHIPFDRNGLKFYRPDGEITKIDEQAILAAEVCFESD